MAASTPRGLMRAVHSCPPTRFAVHAIGVAIFFTSAAVASPQTAKLELTRGDVVAFIGGEAIVRAGESGHLESVLAASAPGNHVRFRNLGREGDTVFEQPR